MSDLGTMLWKEISEFFGNTRSLRVFAMAVGVLGLLPVLEARHGASRPVMELLLPFYILFAGAAVVAQTAPDLVLRERAGRTLEFLLASRLPDGAIFGAKVLMAVALGWSASALAAVLQAIGLNLRAGALASGSWQWFALATPQGRLLALLGPVLLAAYLATIGSFVALRVGDQRAAYTVTMLSAALLAAPFLLHLVTPHFTPGWLERAAAVFAALDVVLVAAGVRLFRRERLVLYLQE